MWRVHCSRALNHHILGGDKNFMISSRMYYEHRYGWMLCIDWWFYTLRGEQNHCFNSYYLDVKERHNATYQSSTGTPEEEACQEQAYPPPLARVLESDTEGV